MKRIALYSLLLSVVALCLAPLESRAQEVIGVTNYIMSLNAPPTPIAVTGYSGEVDQVLRFDLEVMGFKIVPQGSAGCDLLLTGSNDGHVEGRLMLLSLNAQKVGRAYNGGTLRQQAHSLANEVSKAAHGVDGIGNTRLVFKRASGQTSEVYVSDFDGFSVQSMSQDGSLVAAPVWVPGKSAIYYTSYKRGNTEILFHDLGTGARRSFAHYNGMNSSAAVSADGRRVAMVLSKNGSPDIYVCNADGTGLTQLTFTREDESSPCWSPDGRWICFAGRMGGVRSLCKVPSSGGSTERISTGTGSPSEPDWSPDGQWIAFTSQGGKFFNICVVKATGGTAVPLVEGEDPSWAGNSRNLVYCRRHEGAGAYTLSLLDVPTKQHKDVPRLSGSNSQPSWGR
jgi:TolB protein